MNKDYSILLIATYKLCVNTGRIILGFLIFLAGCNLHNLLQFFFSRKIAQKLVHDSFFNLINTHLSNPGVHLVCLLAIILIVFSTIEIGLTIGLLHKKRKTVIGLLIMSILWIPVELLFITKFLLIHEIITITLDLIIIFALYRIVRKLHKKNTPKQ